MGLNKEQIEAVEHLDGPCLVKAAPGSGKTSVLIARIVKLIQRDVNPSNIMCLTFTNKAASEMRARAYKKIGDKAATVWISTFHSMCVKLLRKLGKKINVLPNFSVYDDKDQSDLIMQIARKMEYESFGNGDVYRVQYAINNSRENIESITEYEFELTREQYAVAVRYLEVIDTLDAVDFSGLLYKTWSLFENHPDVRDQVSSFFKYIMVDESQDTNFIQYQIIKQIGKHSNIFIVSDYNQSIYSFRGARPENLVDFVSEYENIVTISLPRNYRSTEKILKAAQCLINHNENAKDTILVADRKEVALPIFVQPCNNSISEARYISNEINRLKSQDIPYEEMAILYRINSLSRELEIQLRNNNIPYRIVGGFSFFDRKEIMNSLAYLRLLANKHDTIAFARAIQYPSRQIGPAKIGLIETVVHDEKIDIIRAIEKTLLNDKGFSSSSKSNLNRFSEVYNKCYQMKEDNCPTIEIINTLFKESGLWAQIQKDSESDDSSINRLENLKEFLVGIDQYFKENPKEDIADYLQTLQIISKDKPEKDLAGVALMTMHAAKGLEFPVVFIAGAEEGIIPHKRALDESNGNDSEERRLMYVAVTRAKERLCITHSHIRGNQRKVSIPSRFIEELQKSKDEVKTNGVFYAV